jgi:hypothetical protein
VDGTALKVTVTVPHELATEQSVPPLLSAVILKTSAEASEAVANMEKMIVMSRILGLCPCRSNRAKVREQFYRHLRQGSRINIVRGGEPRFCAEVFGVLS